MNCSTAWRISNCHCCPGVSRPGCLSRDEVLEVIARFVTDHRDRFGDLPETDPAEILDELARRGPAVQRYPSPSPPRHRTRMAETLRLTSRLRQLFAPQGPDRPISRPTGGRLGPPWSRTSDCTLRRARIRIATSPVARALGELGDLPGWTQMQGDVATAQIKGRDLARFQVDAAAEIYPGARHEAHPRRDHRGRDR